MTCFTNTKISITGDLGSGKSSVCSIIKEKYGFEIYYTGKIQREIAERYNMTTLELNRYSETHPEIDREIDGALAAVGKTEGNLLLDSRMAWHFVPHSFKVFLKVDIDVSADRVINNQRGKVEQYKNHAEAIDKIMLRKSSENMRYLSKYGVDCSDMDNFDLVIDTSFCKVETIAETIISNLEKWSRGEAYPKLWLSTRFIFPTAESHNSTECVMDADKGCLCGVVECESLFYIYGDHCIANENISKGIELTPVCHKGKDSDQLSEGMTVTDYIKRNFSLDKAKAWEDRNGFKFPKYPDIQA
jgi:cytidylate kinase